MSARGHPDGVALKILIWGAGPVGLFLGGTLQKEGAEVLFLGREALLSQFCSGLSLHRRHRFDQVGPLKTVFTLAEAVRMGPFQHTLVSFKSFHNTQVIPQASQLPSKNLVVVQNGLGNEEMFRQAGLSVIGAALTCSVRLGEPGVVKVGRGGLGLAPADLSVDLAVLFRKAGLATCLYSSWSVLKANKWLLNILGNPLAAILEMPAEQYLATKAGFRLERILLVEGLGLLRTLGFPLVNLPGFPVRALPLFLHLPQEVWRLVLGQGRGGKLPSLLLDLRAGRSLEYEAMLSTPLRLGRERGLSLPLLALLERLLSSSSPGDFSFHSNPQRLLETYRALPR